MGKSPGQVDPHMAKPASQNYAPHIGDTCSIWPEGSGRCSLPENPGQDKVAPAKN